MMTFSCVRFVRHDWNIVFDINVNIIRVAPFFWLRIVDLAEHLEFCSDEWYIHFQINNGVVQVSLQ